MEEVIVETDVTSKADALAYIRSEEVRRKMRSMDDNGAIFVASTLKFLIDLAGQGTNTVITQQLTREKDKLRSALEQKNEEYEELVNENQRQTLNYEERLVT